MSIKSVTFEDSGAYVVRLFVQTADKKDGVKTALDGIATKRIIVSPRSSTADFKINGIRYSSIFKTTLKEASEGLSFDPSLSLASKGRKIISWNWNFGDGIKEEKQIEEIIGHEFAKKNIYNVQLTIEDNTGRKDTKSIKIEIKDIVANLDIFPENPEANDMILFSARRSISSSSKIKSYFWEITGGEENNNKGASPIVVDSSSLSLQSKSESFKRMLIAPGDYEVKLTVEDWNGEKAIEFKKLKVNSQKPLVNFYWKIKDSAQPSKVYFDASKSRDPDGDKLLYSWDFDGNGIYELIDLEDDYVVYEYDRVGIFSAKLKVSDPFDQEVYLAKNVSVDSVFNVDFTFEPDLVRIEEEIEFEADCKQAVGFIWDFGDGNRVVTDSLFYKYKFKEKGRYLVRLTAIDENNEENSIEKLVYVGDKNAPMAMVDFYKNNERIDFENGVCFPNNKGVNPLVADRMGADISRADSVKLDAGSSVNKDGTKRKLSFEWEVNGRKYSGSSINRNFTEITSEGSCLPVILKVVDEATGSFDEMKIYFKVRNSVPEFDGFIVKAPDNGNLKTPVSVSLLVKNPRDLDGRIVQYKWWAEREADVSEKVDLHTTSVSSSKVTILPRGFTGQRNRWRFFVEVKDNDGATVRNEELFGLSDFVEVVNSENLRSEVDFRIAGGKNKIMMNDSVTFIANVIDPLGGSLEASNYAWDFDGDGIFDDVSSGARVSRIYERPGEYNVRLRVENRGLATSKVRTIYVDRTSRFPLAAFTFQQSGRKVSFDASNSRYDGAIESNDLRFEWDFDLSKDSDGDGVRDNDVDAFDEIVEFVYSKESSYRVKLSVRDVLDAVDFVDRVVQIVKSGRIESVGSSVKRSVEVFSNMPMTTIDLILPVDQVPGNSSVDVMALVNNADGSVFNGEVEFVILEGSGSLVPEVVRAVDGEASTTLHVSGSASGKILVQVIARGTFSGEVRERIWLGVE